MTMVAQQAEMEDIISSIRTSLAEETAKVGGGSADLIDAAAAQDEVLELTADEMVPVDGGASPAVPSPLPADDADDLIDIAAFAKSGEAKAVAPQAAQSQLMDLLGEPVAAPASPAVPEGVPAPQPAAEVAAAPAAVEAPVDEFDALLSQISQQQQQQAAAAEEHKKALLAEEEPLGEIPVVQPEKQVQAAPAVDASVASAVAAISEAVEAAVEAETPGQMMQLEALEGANGGLQIGLPAEVLAMALRPMVQEWLKANLPGVVERLVKEEISKMTQ